MVRAKAASWLGLGAAVIVLVSPLKLWWAQASSGWLTPFALWLLLIALGAWLARR
jgi:hypothetical protein